MTPGRPITRTKDGVTHWMRWLHHATMPDGRVFVLETTDSGIPSAGSVSGFTVHSVAELVGDRRVLVGFMPGTADPPPITIPPQLILQPAPGAP